MSENRSDGFKAEISKQELLDYDIIAFEGKIVCVEDLEDINEAVADLKNFNTLGFDTETRPSFKKGKINSVSLLQLSARNRAYLFRLNRTGLPQHLASILANPDIVKVGVAIHDDIKALQTLRGFTPAGFIELQEMVKEYGITDAGLKKLSAIILGSTISKRQQVTNWENPVLSQAQKVYAATDAWVCLKIYEKLKESSPVKKRDKGSSSVKEREKRSGSLKEVDKESSPVKERDKGSRSVKERDKGSDSVKGKDKGSWFFKKKKKGE